PGCLSGKTLPHFTVDEATHQALAAYRSVADRERYPSAFEARQERSRSCSCLRCHQRDSDRPAPIEDIGSKQWTIFNASLPFQRTPPLTQAHAKYTRDYLLTSVRDGVTGVRPNWYTYPMPAFGAEAAALVQALAEGDG